MRVAVVTPTINSPHLWKCAASVQQQTYQDIIHYVFIDGKEHFLAKDEVDFQRASVPVKYITLDDNIGKGGWYGHRVYAACSFLVNADIICYLDEDNTIDLDHISSLVEVISRGNDWAFSLRKIIGQDGSFLCYDDCESLGLWPVFNHPTFTMVDTSCFAVKRDVAVRIGHAWYANWGADRVFFQNLKHHFPKFDCTKKYTLNYRLEGNEGSVSIDFFKEGNEVNHKRYKTLPWRDNGIDGIYK